MTIHTSKPQRPWTNGAAAEVLRGATSAADLQSHDARTDEDRVQRSRGIEQRVLGSATSDGAGVQLTRVLTHSLQRRLDPFLLLDAFGSEDPNDYIAGFPDHPHRGFETVTYMLSGRMRHRDSAGHEGLIETGGVQWMTAGSGLVHSEIPQQTEGRMEGFQLWVNLPARDKMVPPWYRNFTAAELPRLTTAEGVRATLIAGVSRGVVGAVRREATDPLLIDLELPGSSGFAQRIAPTHNAFVYAYRGVVRIGGESLPSGRMAILENAPDADGVLIESDGPARALLVAGRPLGEPIVQHGPFVMNSPQEIRQAILDYSAGRMGPTVSA